MASISFNPALTTNAAGSFNVSATGLVQGTAFPDPAYRYALKSGWLLTAETLPIWGGVGIFQQIPGYVAGAPSRTLGCPVGRATALTGTKPLTAFAVFDQAYGMINTPQSPVPLAGSGGQVMYYELGSKARIAVQADPNLISLVGSLVNTSVSWDFTNQKLIPYSAPTFSSATYTSGTGVVSITTAAAHGLLPGDEIIVSSAAGTGTFATINGLQVLTAGTTGSTLNFVVATGQTMTISGATLATGGVLPVNILDIQSTNCQVVSYDPVSGFATWNYNGAAAVIEL
jgi:hypothetical protein